MFRASSAHLQEDTVVHSLLFIHKILFSSTCSEPQVLIFRRIQLCKMQHMVLSLSMRVLGGSTICYICTIVSSWRWALEARNM